MPVCLCEAALCEGVSQRQRHKGAWGYKGGERGEEGEFSLHYSTFSSGCLCQQREKYTNRAQERKGGEKKEEEKKEISLCACVWMCARHAPGYSFSFSQLHSCRVD